MKSITFLYAAFVVTWVIHFGYILSLVGRARKLREEMHELDRESRRSGD